MKISNSRKQPETPTSTRVRRLTLAVAAALAAGAMQSAAAFTVDSANPDLKIRWDNTLKYTAGWRLHNPEQFVADGNGLQPNTDYGDLAHKKGLINNRVDLLSEFDVLYKNVGFRVSGAAWYDAEYMKNHNDYPGTVPNSQAALAGGANNLNSSAAKNIMGKRAEILDAFAYGSVDVGEESKITLRAGKHTQLYGETLFLGANGIANAQGPVDLVKAFSLPNAQFKEIAIPVGQVSSDIQINSSLSLGAYFQYDWKPLRLPAAGSYFGAADFVGEGGDLLLAPFGPAPRLGDLKGSNSGNFGARVKFKVKDTEYGLYAARYDDKAPIPVLDATNFAAPAYRLMYATKIDAYGASFSTVFGETNVAGEVSTRRNTPLAPLGDLVISTMPNADNKDNTPYARGNSLHFNLSAITVLPANALWQGASFVGEFAFNRLLSVTHNPLNSLSISALNSTHTRDSSAFRLVFQPEYFQVLPGVDLQVPIGVGYGLSGRSAVFQVAPEHGGDFSIGVNADVDKTWKAGLNFTHYFGERGPAPSLNPATNSYASYKQYYVDRDFISFTVQRTF